MPSQTPKHLFLDPLVFGETKKYQFSSKIQREYPERDRASHAQKLLSEIDMVVQDAQTVREKRQKKSLPVVEGVRLEFSGQPGSAMNLKSLESPSKGVYLLNSKEISDSNGKKSTVATVLFSPGTQGKPNAYFADKVIKFRDENTDKNKPRNDDLIRSIEKISPSTFEAFWYDDIRSIPEKNQKIWCEIWVNHPYHHPKKKLKTNNSKKKKSGTETRDEVVKRFRSVCEELKIECSKVHLTFPDQLVFLGHADGDQLKELVDAFDMLSSFNLHREPTTFWTEMPVREQIDWIENLRSRMVIEPNPKCSVCILDTGVNNQHPLFRDIIPDEFRYTTRMDGMVGDWAGSSAHGTAMCSVAAFGDLSGALESSQTIHINHTVESVKILHERKANEPEFHGEITKRAILLAESAAPHFIRTVCMAITSDEKNNGTPSAWSAQIDQLAFGEEADDEEEKITREPRLVLLSAGNVDSDDWANYPTSNETAYVENPAQSWNALVVGAYTNKTQTTELGTEGYEIVAQQGALSPFSRTSLTWEKNWPLKPDIVLEGGNLAKAPDGKVYDLESLAVLAAAHDWENRGNHFTPFRGTSPATAQAAYMAASIFTEYQNAWPETVRGILVHSARWTPAMSIPKLKNAKKGEIKRLIQQFGFGVPNLSRSLHSLKNRMTMVIQDDSLLPYVRNKSVNQYGNFRLFELPWPKQELLSYGETESEIRITLSYFISPSPGEKGWGNQYRYPSYTLRFDINNSGEDKEAFLNRLIKSQKNEERLDSDENGASSVKWTVGTSRNGGSIHTDFWRDTSAAIAESRYVAVYPRGGWWKERHLFGKEKLPIRFSLIASLEIFAETKTVNNIETPIDIFTPIQKEIEFRTSIAVPSKNTVEVEATLF